MGNKQAYQRLTGGAKDDAIPKGDPVKGALIFKEHCEGCHVIDKSGEHGAGPNLMGLWGREASTIADFPFEGSDDKKGVVWGDKSVFDYLDKAHIPGTKFFFRDLQGRSEDKANLLAYLKQVTDPTSKES